MIDTAGYLARKCCVAIVKYYCRILLMLKHTVLVLKHLAPKD